MGMIVMLYLISSNVYNSVDGPKGRGFSYIEIWMLGTQFPIILALIEYGLILMMKKYCKTSSDQNQDLYQGNMQPDLDNVIKKLDFGTLIFSFIYFVIYASIYWIFSYA